MRRATEVSLDWITGESGDDTISAGAGDDTIDAGFLPRRATGFQRVLGGVQPHIHALDQLARQVQTDPASVDARLALAMLDWQTQALLAREIHVTVVELADRILGTIFDVTGSRIAESILRREGVDLRTGTAVEEVVVRGGRVDHAVLHNGERIYPGALEVLAELSRRNKRAVLLTNSGRRRSYNEERLQELGYQLGPEPSPVVAVRVADIDGAIALWKGLLECGVYVNLVTPPATPDGGCLLRCSVSAGHTPEQMDRICEAFTAVRKAVKTV